MRRGGRGNGLKDALTRSEYELRVELGLAPKERLPLGPEMASPLGPGLVVRQVLLGADPRLVAEVEYLLVLSGQVLEALRRLARVGQGRPQKRHQVEHVLVRRHRRAPLVPPGGRFQAKFNKLFI